MFRKYTVISFIVSVMALFGTSAYAQEGAPSVGEDPLTIAVTPVKPFAYRDSKGKWTGISIDLWEEIALRNGLKYEYKNLTLANNLKSTANGNSALGLGAITINQQREHELDFSHAYHPSGLTIISQENDSFLTAANIWLFVKSVLSLIIFIAIGGFIFRALCGEQFKTCPKGSLYKSYWWSVVTLTTTGYGDIVPENMKGKMFAAAWMILGAIAFPLYIGSIAATTVSQETSATISDHTKLHEYKIGAVRNTTGAHYLEDNNIKFQKYRNVDNLIKAVKNGHVDGGVYDTPMLQYQMKQHSGLKLLPYTFATQFYGFILPSNSSLREDVNRSIPTIIQDEQWNAVLNKYLTN